MHKMRLEIALGIFCLILSAKAFTLNRTSTVRNPMENKGFFEGDIAGIRVRNVLIKHIINNKI